jgi:hypothetical protein
MNFYVHNYYKYDCVDRIQLTQDGFQGLTTIITLINFKDS